MPGMVKKAAGHQPAAVDGPLPCPPCHGLQLKKHQAHLLNYMLFLRVRHCASNGRLASAHLHRCWLCE